MTNDENSSSLSLLVRRTVSGSPAEVFRAWTDPEQVRQWWGPGDVVCRECSIDLRVGGTYRIANQMPDDSVLWITGEFLRLEPPHLIEYTWRRGLESQTMSGSDERVSVRFSDLSGQTEVLVEHSRILDRTDYESHEYGWLGCLDGLAGHLETSN